MASLFATGRVAELIVAMMLLEFCALTLLHRRFGRGVPPLELAASLGAGAALLLALRAALAGDAWPRVAIWLVFALIAHGLYLRLRWGARRAS